jgi:hypothetical protein
MATVQFVGYAARASAHNKTGKLMPYIVQNNFILLAPVLFAASIYMVLGRIIRATQGEAHSLIKPKRLTKLFVIGDVLSLAIQGGGAGFMVVGDKAKLGQAIVLVGLVFQIVIFGIFCATSLRFHSRMRRDPIAAWVPAETQWEQMLYMLYAVSVLIMLRSVFRVIEFAMGADGYLLSNEWPLYIFDTVPMFIVMGVFWKWFPSNLNLTGSRMEVTSMNNLTVNSEAQMYSRR